ncbi:LysR family transcriptional regulator [Janthinobacterium agaricidamnosum]|uniref:Bacterial regulatory helix-turn-helix, lysR family protein n=1 Tax=Janthinobacterium agaricidamnosum NBRC 102515 = DSM 9628 TaxID=1349767 RepID=W0VEM6_9BURK|nr:LysR family transcriptional regulator [Janthinobacterium agaricidamnosum]CDG85792.1 bacterial regulatory helix-turn-helix, lysR family protein [Janthinobacterium agaricidamnosum NBRC 102515 = DSM 9628]
MKPIRFEDLEIFVHALNSRSFSGAARILDISPVVASNAVKRLEESLGTRLFERTTRSLRVTEHGIQYAVYAQAALRSMKDGTAAMSASKKSFGGSLRLALPSDFGRNHLLGWIEEHLEDIGRLEMNISIGDTLFDLHSRPVDLTIRYGVAKDSSLIVLPIASENRRILCASPAYLNSNGSITRLEQLVQHNCLRFKLDGVVHSRWNFGSGPESIPMVVEGNRVTDDAELVRRWAVAGLGIAYKSRLDVAEDLQAGRLIHVLPDILGEPAPLSMCVVHRSLLTPAVYALIRFLKGRCQLHLSAPVSGAVKA